MRCTPKGGRADDDAISFAYVIIDMWEDIQSDIDEEGEEYREMVKSIFNEYIDNSDDLGDVLVGEDPNDFLSAIKNLDEVAREQFMRLFK